MTAAVEIPISPTGESGPSWNGPVPTSIDRQPCGSIRGYRRRVAVPDVRLDLPVVALFPPHVEVLADFPAMLLAIDEDTVALVDQQLRVSMEIDGCLAKLGNAVPDLPGRQRIDRRAPDHRIGPGGSSFASRTNMSSKVARLVRPGYCMECRPNMFPSVSMARTMKPYSPMAIFLRSTRPPAAATRPASVAQSAQAK